MLWSVQAGVVAAMLSVAMAGCGTKAFTCNDDAQCLEGGVAGACLAPGFCAFPDDQCGSGLRFGSHAEEGLAGQCVPPPGETDTFPDLTTSATSAASFETTDTTATSLDPATSSSTTLAATGGLTSTTSTATATTSTATTDPGSSTGAQVEPGLVLWYTFDDVLADGPEDSSGSRLHGDCAQCPAATPGVQGSAALFDGTTQFVQVPSSPLLDLTEAMTVTAFVRFDAWPQGYALIANRPVGSESDNSWEIYTETTTEGSALQLTTVDADGMTRHGDVPIEQITDTWQHVAMVWDGTDIILYLDAVPIIEYPLPSILYDDHAVRVGADLDFEMTGNFFPGALDDVRIYDHALTPEEVAELAAP